MRYLHRNFFKYVSTTFGILCSRLLKSWINQQKLIINNKIRVTFLKACIQNNIVPIHLQNIIGNKLIMSDHNCNRKIKHLRHVFATKILKIELNDAHKSLNSAKIEVCRLVREISKHLPVYLYSKFFRLQNSFLHFLFTNKKHKIFKKIDNLIQKQTHTAIKNTKSIRFHSWHSTQNNVLKTTNTTNNNNPLDLSPYSIHSNEMIVKPTDFINNIPTSSLFSKRDNWLVNLTPTIIPHDVHCLMQLGENFSLPTQNRKKITIELVKNIEYNTSKFDINTQLTLRNRFIPIIKNLPFSDTHNNLTNQKLHNLLKSSKNFTKNNPHIIFTRADKGNTTVMLERKDYNNKINDMLLDIDTYTKIKKDPLNKMINDLRCLLTRWKNSKYISAAKYKHLYCSEGNLPRAYGLPKIHKPGNPFRLIISSIDSPFYYLASWLQRLIIDHVPNTFSHLDNSFNLIEKLRNVDINEKHVLISLDVISLFTNIPLDLAIESVSRRWEYISVGCSIPREEFLCALRLIFDSTYFQFDGNIYKQNFGTPMGSPLSPIISDLVMRDIEERALEILNLPLPFYFRYVDDILMAIPSDSINNILNIFNNLHPRLQFTLEIGGDKINFLDVTIIKNNNKLEFNWYHKPTFSGRYLNYFSQHPLSQKRGTIMGMVDRAILLSDPKFQHDNLCFIINVLLKNDYPLSFIFDTVNTRLKSFSNVYQKRNTNTESKDTQKWFTIPFLNSVSHKFKHLTKDLDTKISYYSLNKLNTIIKGHKDELPNMSKRNVVYKLACKNCSATYVGQTCRTLKTRISEHKNHIHRNTTTHSVITEHRLNFSHEFDWNNVEILDQERFLTRRLISEMIHIKRQNNSLNLQSDTENLDDGIISILNKLQ